MEWLNYHHLLYFWVVAREGGLAPASKVLRLAHPTISGQIKQLEASLGEELFDRSGRRLQLTEMGRMVYQYADEIFGLGRELMDTVKGRPTGRPARLRVGITDVVPKLIVHRLLQPAFHLEEPVRVCCQEDRHDRLLAGLVTHDYDVVVTDAPVTSASNVRAFNHLLGECGVSFMGAPQLAEKYAANYPESLHGAPMLMPTHATSLRRNLERWFDKVGVVPEIVAEFEDSALLKVFGQDGSGIFAMPTVIEDAVTRQYDVKLVGRCEAVRERFYAISAERRLRNPAVVAICESAKHELFG